MKFLNQGRTVLLMLCLILIFTGCRKKDETPDPEPTPSSAPTNPAEPTEKPEKPVEKKIKVSTYNSQASVHDPSIEKGEDGTYYLFGSHMDAAKSTDLWLWKSFATGVNSSNKLFDGLFDSAAFDWVGRNEQGGYSVWAPDVIYNKAMGKWCMYFCTTQDWNTSTLCFATADSIEGPYVFQANLIHSGFKADDVSKTNVSEILGYDGADRGYWTAADYNSNDWPNALDPSVFYDKDGRLWMVYGSWSGGIFILELDEGTGLPIHPEDDPENGVDKYFGKHLLGRGHKSCEGPYIMYCEETGYYYLFVSYGGLTSEGGYNIRMFRSEQPDGPYVDAKGQTWLTEVSNHSAYGVKVMGNYYLPSLSKAYMAPGHNSAMVDDDGKILLAYHTRFDDGQEFHQPRIHQMFVTENGWLAAAPFAFNQFGERTEELVKTGYPKEDLVGTYYYVPHMSDTSKIIHGNKDNTIELKEDGTISGTVKGTWEQINGTCKAVLTIAGVTYQGVFFRQTDEAFQDTMTFTCVSDTNLSIWGVKYLQ